MSKSHDLELISFSLCPYVQRSVITLKHKKVDFKLTYIDLFNPPEWFDKLSPLGQVPVLKVTEKATGKVSVVFESAVINEYLDETVGIRLHPEDALERAVERAWIAFASELQGSQYALSKIADEAELAPMIDELFTDMSRLEDVVSKEGPFFRGKQFGLVDTTFAPFFQRIFMADRLSPFSAKADARWRSMPRTVAWAKALLALPEVRESVHADFEKDFRGYVKKMGSALYGR